MNLTSLESLIALSRTLNVTRTADSLNISQPAFSRMLSKTEETLGIQIFERTNKGVTITPEGEIFLKSLENSLEILESGLKSAKESQKREKELLIIGYVPDAINQDIIETISIFKASRNNVVIQLKEVYYYEMFSALKSKRVDAVVYTSFLPNYSNNIEHYKLWETELVALVSKSGTWSNKKQLKPYDIQHANIIDLRHDDYLSRSWSFCQKFCKYFNIYPENITRAACRPSLYTQVACSDSVTLTVAVEDSFYDFKTMHVKTIPIENCPPCERHIIWNKGCKTQLLDDFIAVLKTVGYKRS